MLGRGASGLQTFGKKKEPTFGKKALRLRRRTMQRMRGAKLFLVSNAMLWQSVDTGAVNESLWPERWQSRLGKLVQDGCNAKPFNHDFNSTILKRTQMLSSLGGMAPSHYRTVLAIFQSRAPTNALVFSVGRDSTLWQEANSGGRTVFVEDNEIWARRVALNHPELHILRAKYTRHWGPLLKHFALRGSTGLDACIEFTRGMWPPAEQIHRTIVHLHSQLVRQLDEMFENQHAVREPWRVFHIDGPTSIDGVSRLEPVLVSLQMACSSVIKYGGSAAISLHDISPARPCEMGLYRSLLLGGMQGATNGTCQLWPYEETTGSGQRPDDPMAVVKVDVTHRHPFCMMMT